MQGREKKERKHVRQKEIKDRCLVYLEKNIILFPLSLFLFIALFLPLLSPSSSSSSSSSQSLHTFPLLYLPPLPYVSPPPLSPSNTRLSSRPLPPLPLSFSPLSLSAFYLLTHSRLLQAVIMQWC